MKVKWHTISEYIAKGRRGINKIEIKNFGLPENP